MPLLSYKSMLESSEENFFKITSLTKYGHSRSLLFTTYYNKYIENRHLPHLPAPSNNYHSTTNNS